TNEVDIIFLDINMPVKTGLDPHQTLTSKDMGVIPTAHEGFALKRLELQGIDYSVKPIPFPRFLKTVNRIIDLKERNKKVQTPVKDENPSIFVKIDKKKLQKVYLNDIIVIESLKDYIHIKTKNNKYIIHRTLGSFTDELPQDKF